MMLRRCGACSWMLPLPMFAWRRVDKGQRDNYCRPCRAAYKQRHYRANRARYIATAEQRRHREVAQRMTWLMAFYRDHPCVDCGETDPIVLEFDHIGEKRFDISSGLRDRRWSDVLDEIERCEVVCANCHRRRTTLRAGSIRSRYSL